jgi:hypothetical protein
MIRKLKSGQYRLYSRRKNPKTGLRRPLGTFPTRKAAEDYERAGQIPKDDESSDDEPKSAGQSPQVQASAAG